MIDFTLATCQKETSEIATEYLRRYKHKPTTAERETIFHTRDILGWKKLNFFRAMDVVDRMLGDGTIKAAPSVERLCNGLPKLIDIWDEYPENVGRESWREGDFELTGRAYKYGEAQ